MPLIILEALPADGWESGWTPHAIADTEELIWAARLLGLPPPESAGGDTRRQLPWPRQTAGIVRDK